MLATNELYDALWQVGEDAVKALADVYTYEIRGGELSAKATLAGAASLMAASRALASVRGLRLKTILSFEADLSARQQNKRVSLMSYITAITGTRQDDTKPYHMPPQMNRQSWEVLGQLVMGMKVPAAVISGLVKVDSAMSADDWSELARRIRDSNDTLQLVTP